MNNQADLFYMKTCHFRGARPPLAPRPTGLFCLDEPQVRYGMVPCNRRSCTFCYPRAEIRQSRHRPNHPDDYESVVQFSTAQKHRFVNGYEAILNCPTSCLTYNLIYALTCPCGQFDYVGYTSRTLGQRLQCLN